MARLDTSGLGRDVVINSVRYPLVVDKQRGVSWWHEGDEAVNESIPQQVARKVWESGFSGGMGETQQYAPGTDGYAFSAGWDAVKPGRIKLSGRRSTVTPGSSPVDLMTNGWIRGITAGGTAVYNVFTFTKSATPGTTSQTVTHGLSVAPKAFIFWTSGMTVSGTVGATPQFALCISDGTTGRSIATISSDASPAADAKRRYANVSIIAGVGATGPAGTLASIGASTFDINWTNNSSDATIFHGIAIGGSDVSASVDEWTMGAATGNKSVTGVGFKPTLCLHIANLMTAAGGDEASAAMMLGAMDDSGNQWGMCNVSVDTSDPTITERYQRTDATIVTSGGDGAANSVAAYVSMDDDGFTTNFSAVTAGLALVATLSLKGIQASVGAVLKTASTANQTAVSLPFTTSAFMVASTFQGASSTVNAHAAFGLGAASGTTAVEASAYYDEDNVATTDTYGLDDTALAFEIIDAAGTEVDTATCGNINMGTAGWLTWATPSADASQLCYIGFAALAPDAGTQFVYISNGQRVYKMSVSGTTITVQETKDHGANTQAGSNALFEDKLYLSLGQSPNGQELTTVAAAGSTDTWTSMDVPAQALARFQDGSTAKLLRGHTANLVDLAADISATPASGDWSAADFEVGDTTKVITNMVDTGTAAYVSKTDGLYRWLGEGVSQQIIESQPDSENGCGLLAIEGTDAVIYNDLAGLWFFDGANLPFLIGPDANDINQPIDNITHEPRGGRHLETAKVGKWYFSVYRVTETTTKTYILAGYRTGNRWTWHTEWRYDGVVRGVVPDDQMRLWHVFPFDGTIGYHQLDEDGCPDPGRNSIGHGAASTTYTFTLSESLFSSIAYLHSVEIFTVNNGSTTPVQLYYQADAGSLTTFGSAQTGNGLARVFKGTTAVGAHRWRLQLSVATTAGYDNTDTTPLEVRAVQMLFWVRPQKSDRIHFVVDAGAKLSSDVSAPDDALTMRANLKALARGSGSGPAVACTDPDGATIYINPNTVSDATLREVDGELHWTIDCWATEWTTASQ